MKKGYSLKECIHDCDKNYITSIDKFHPETSDDDLKILSEFPNLTTLNLSGCKKITNVGLEQLAIKPDLTCLDLSDTQIDDAGLKQLSILTRLTSLDLKWCNITDSGLEHLKAFTALSSLSLKNYPTAKNRTTTKDQRNKYDTNAVSFIIITSC